MCQVRPAAGPLGRSWGSLFFSPAVAGFAMEERARLLRPRTSSHSAAPNVAVAAVVGQRHDETSELLRHHWSDSSSGA